MSQELKDAGKELQKVKHILREAKLQKLKDEEKEERKAKQMLS